MCVCTHIHRHLRVRRERLSKYNFKIKKPWKLSFNTCLPMWAEFSWLAHAANLSHLIIQFSLCTNYNLIDLLPSGFGVCFILGSPTDCSCKFSLPMYTLAHKRASGERVDEFIPIPTARQLWRAVGDEPQRSLHWRRTSQEERYQSKVQRLRWNCANDPGPLSYV